MKYKNEYLCFHTIYLIYTGCPKKCPSHIYYVNDTLSYAHLHRLPHVNLKQIKTFTNPTWGKPCKCA